MKEELVYTQQPSEQVSSKINSVPEPTPAKSKFCHHRGQMNHKASKCQFKEAICHMCGNKGHLKKVF